MSPAGVKKPWIMILFQLIRHTECDMQERHRHTILQNARAEKQKDLQDIQKKKESSY